LSAFARAMPLYWQRWHWEYYSGHSMRESFNGTKEKRKKKFFSPPVICFQRPYERLRWENCHFEGLRFLFIFDRKRIGTYTNIERAYAKK